MFGLRKRWRGTVQSRIVLHMRDFWSDFFQTLREVCQQHTPAQVCAGSFISVLYLLIHLAIWAVASIPLGFLVYVLWQAVLVELFPDWFRDDINPLHTIGLVFLTHLMLFRSIRIELPPKRDYD